MLHSYIDHRGSLSGVRSSLIVYVLAAGVLLIGFRWPLTFAAIAGCIGLAAVVLAANFTRLHPKWLILPLLLNEAASSIALIPDSIRPVLRYALLALFCLPFLPAILRSDTLKRGGFKLYLLYFAWAGVTVIFSLNPLYSFARVTSAVLLFASVVTAIADIKEEAEMYELFGIFWIGSAIIMMALFMSLALPADLTWAPDDSGISRFSGLFNNPNQVGELVLTTVASGVIFWSAASRRQRWLIAVSIILALFFDGLADSRSPFIALMIGLLLFAIAKYKARAIPVAGAILAGGLILFAQLGGGRAYVTRGDVTSFTGRTEVWKYVVHAIEERPITGWGYEVEGEIFQNRDFPLWEEIWNQGPRSSVHNGYLSRASGVGIPATLLWIFLMVRALSFGLLSGKAPGVLRNAALIGGVPVLIMNLVESTAGDCRYSVGLLLALIWTLSEQCRISHASPASKASLYNLIATTFSPSTSVVPVALGSGKKGQATPG